MGSPTKFFGTVRQKIFDRNSWYPPLMHKIFRYPKLVKHWRVPLPNFSALWDKNFATENRDTPSLPLSSISIPQFFWNTQGFSVLWDEKFSTENRDAPLLSVNFFSIPENFWYFEGFPYEVFRFGPVRQKIFDKTVMPPMHENFRY